MSGLRIIARSVAFGRWMGFGQNPLRRDVDRVDRAVVLVAIALALLAVPGALFAGAAVHRAGLATSAAQRAVAHATIAVLGSDVPDTGSAADQLGTVPAPGRWSAPDGTVRTGLVDAEPGQSAGSTVTIWTDHNGHQVNPPLTEDEAYWRGILTVVMVMLGVCGCLVISVLCMRRRLDRRRLAAWAEEWQDVEPRWTYRGNRAS